MTRRTREMWARLKAATPGDWTRPLNIRFKNVVVAPLPDDEPSEWKDRIPPEGLGPERVVVVQIPIWSNGRHARKRSGKDLEFVAHAKKDMEDLLTFVHEVEDLLYEREMANEYSKNVGARDDGHRECIDADRLEDLLKKLEHPDE